jgi:large subunit ribosomal protein L17
MSMLRNLATSLINARDERIITTLPKAKELRPFVERVITLSKKAQGLEGDDASVKALHLRRQAAGYFHAGNQGQAATFGKRGQTRAPRTAGVAALKRLFSELGVRYRERNGGYTRIIKLGRRDGDNAELAIIELVENPRELKAAESSAKSSASAGGKKKASAGKTEGGRRGAAKKDGGDAKESGRGRRAKKTESTSEEKDTD